MKLNLLPQTVSKGRALRTGYLFGALILAGAFILCGLMKFAPQNELNKAQTRVDDSAQPAADAYATGGQKDTVIGTAAIVIRNANLAQAMIDHNDVYPNLYGDVLRYVPSFFRLTSMSAQPVDGTTATVTLVGTVGTYQQYADLMLALMRFKDVTSITRTGFVLDLPQVPALTAADQKGIPHKLNEPTLPEGQVDRLNYYESQNFTPAGFMGLNGYGNGLTDTKGPTPKESLITVVLTVKRNLQVCDVAGTLHGGAGAAAAPAGLGGGFGPPAGFGGPGGGGPGGPPPPGAAGATGASRGGAGGD